MDASFLFYHLIDEAKNLLFILILNTNHSIKTL